MCSTIKSVKGCTGISYRYADLQANQPYSASGIKIELFFLCIRCKINTMHKISCVCSKCKSQFVCIRSRKAADICFYSTTFCSDKNETILIMLLVSMSTFVGGLIIFLFPTSGIISVVEPVSLIITLGMLSYISIMELLPRMLQARDKKNVCAGMTIGIMLLLITLFL